MNSHQADYDIRCEWGEHGILELSRSSDVVIIVDVLSFSTCVDIATARGAVLYPYPWKDERAREFAAAVDAELAVARGAGAIINQLTGSLSPEAQAARDAYRGTGPDLTQTIRNCVSGVELIERGYERDVALASELDVSCSVPILNNKSYINAAKPGRCGF